MLFKSPHAAMRFKIRSEVRKYHNLTGEELVDQRKPAIVAEFGQWGAEQAVWDPVSGKSEMHAEMVGHFFDTEEWAASRNPLGDPAVAKTVQQEREMIERVLLAKCETVPGMIQLIERVVAPAPLPWPNFNRLEADQIGPAAVTFEAVPEALLYERENAKRPLVLDALEAALADAPKAVKARAEKQAAYADGAMDVPESSGVVLAGAPARTDGGITAGRSGMPV